MELMIIVDVPEYQDGQEVSVYFKDTMMTKGICIPKDEYDKQKYDKGFVDGRFLGICEVKSKLVHLKQCHAISKEQLEYYGEKQSAEYKNCVKRQICSEIGRYLYESRLVTFTESDGLDNTFRIRADVQVYNEREGVEE